MKDLTKYITEKANFLVKKHVQKENNIVVAKSLDELEDGCYAKVKGLMTVLIKYSDTPGGDKIGYYWTVWFDGHEVKVEFRERNTRYLTMKTRITEFKELTDDDYKIISYVESNQFEPGVKTNIEGKY